MSRPTVAEIDLGALIHNWKILTQLQDSERIIPVIKANAYGHGAATVARTLQNVGVQQVAVALLEEAVEVRAAGFRGAILILGPFTHTDIPMAQELSFTPVVGDKQFLLDLVAYRFWGEIHIKWDTGMNRLGFAAPDIPWVAQILSESPILRVQAFCTHFLKADDFGLEGGHSEQQIQRFQSILAQWESQYGKVPSKHLFNSDSFFLNHETQRLPNDFGARPGITLYGYPAVETTWSRQMKPVMTLKTKIVHLVQVSKGQTVSYNADWVAPRDSVVAVLPVGYADGYPRSLSNKGQVFVRGQTVPLVGIVCMDYLMIEVTDVADVAIGDEVELWGNHISLSELARAAQTITYELLTGVSERVPRQVIDGTR